MPESKNQLHLWHMINIYLLCLSWQTKNSVILLSSGLYVMQMCNVFKRSEKDEDWLMNVSVPNVPATNVWMDNPLPYFVMDGRLFNSLLTHSLQKSSIRLNLSSVKNHLKRRLGGTEGNKKVLSLFPTWKAHYSSGPPLSTKHPLLYLTSLLLVPASPPHKPTLCEWLTQVFLLL